MTDYMVLQAGAIELGFGTSDYVQRLDFELESDYTKGTNFARPILAYIMRPSGDTSVNVYVNPTTPSNVPPGTNILDHHDALFWANWSGGSFQVDQASWEAIDGRLFRPGSNSIYFRVMKGKIRLRDVVLWFQRGTGD
jgi:hypothetical protein